jgi:hypothetical protein
MTACEKTAVVWLSSLFLTVAVPAEGSGPSSTPPKISPDLLELYEVYRAAPARGEGVSPERGQLRIVGDRVLIEAVAAGDVSALETDLIALGLRHAAAFGRVVSGELPIAAIPSLQSLASLALARSSTPSRRLSPRPTPDDR